jgi:UPF0755 protein
MPSGETTPPKARRGSGRLSLALAGALCAVIAGAGLWTWTKWRAFLQTPAGSSTDVAVQIAAGEELSAVAEKLARANVIQDEWLFRLDVARVRHVEGQIRPGEYLFHAGQLETPDEVIDRLLRDEVQAARVTIPPGLRIEDEAPLLQAAGLAGGDAFIRVAHDRKFVHSLGIKAQNLEGYLFPDTYLVPKDYSAAQLARLMLDRFRGAWGAASALRNTNVTLTMHEAVTLASILQKEGGPVADWPHLSCVFHNRLKDNMKLQANSTVAYSIFLRTGRYDAAPREADFETPHPYNTYTATGLPPGPIANPGLAALKAALNPSACSDLYYVTLGDGTHAFCADAGCRDAAQRKVEIDQYFHPRPK